jgi:hypothetical protein
MICSVDAAGPTLNSPGAMAGGFRRLLRPTVPDRVKVIESHSLSFPALALPPLRQCPRESIPKIRQPA